MGKYGQLEEDEIEMLRKLEITKKRWNCLSIILLMF